MADYQIILYDPFGVKLAILDGFTALDMVRRVNRIGALTLTLPTIYDQYLFVNRDVKVDNRIEVYRKVGDGGYYLEGGCCWFVVGAEKLLLSNGVRVTKVQAEDAIGLLARRIVAYSSGASQASKSAGAADNRIKDIIDENFGVAATDTNRNLSAYLSIQADLSLGASVAKAFARRNVLEVLQEYADASQKAGMYLAFDIMSSTLSTLEFRTYTGQRGIDRRWPNGANPVLLGPEFGNLTNITLGYHHDDETNYAYAGGQGEGASRAIGISSDMARINASPFNRRERFIDARMTADTAQLANEADAAIRAGDVKRTFAGEFQNTSAITYGLHLNFGDYVTASFDDETIDCRVEMVHITVKDEAERIEIKLRGEA